MSVAGDAAGPIVPHGHPLGLSPEPYARRSTRPDSHARIQASIRGTALDPARWTDCSPPTRSPRLIPPHERAGARWARRDVVQVSRTASLRTSSIRLIALRKAATSHRRSLDNALISAILPPIASRAFQGATATCSHSHPRSPPLIFRMRFLVPRYSFSPQSIQCLQPHQTFSS